MVDKDKEIMGLSVTFWIFFIGICLTLLLFLTIGFSIYSHRAPDVILEEKDAGKVVLNYSTQSNNFTILDAIPTTDAIASKSMTAGQYFDFSVDVDVEDASKVEYEVSIIKNEKKSTISDEDIMIYLEKENDGSYDSVFSPKSFVSLKESSKIGSDVGSMVLVNTKKIKSGTDRYRLRMWLSERSTVLNGTYSVDVEIHAIAK